MPHRTIVVVAACRPTPAGWRVAMRRRPSDGLLGGLWEFPEWEHDVDPPRADALPEVEHTFSHFRATYRPFAMTIAGSEGSASEEASWIPADEIGALALPVAQRKIAGHLEEWLAGRDDAP